MCCPAVVSAALATPRLTGFLLGAFAAIALVLAAGLAGAVGLTRLMASVLYDVTPTDPWTYTAVIVGLMGVAAAASLLPALRAARVNPLVALRSE